ncbi:MAG TPA: hypothetical protein VIB62_01215 [Actinomycetota bacterium]
MPTLDEELRNRLRAAAPVPEATEDLGGRLAERRRRRRAQRTAGRVALIAVVVIGTVAGVAALDRAFRGGSPAVTEPPAPSLDPTGALTLEGIPFRVCRPMTIPGGFGAGADTLWVFEEESAPGAGCEERGHIRVAVGTSTGVVATTGRLDRQLQGVVDGAAPWPYAALDLNDDGVQESLAIGVGGSRDEGYARIVLFRLTPEIGGTSGAIRSIVLRCGSECPPWLGLGTFVESLAGAYCDVPTSTGQPALIHWTAGEGVVEGTAWYLEGDLLREDERVFSRPDDGSYPPDGTSDLCGSPVSWPEDFPTYAAATSLAPELPGVDVGGGFRLCDPSTIEAEFDGDAGAEIVTVGTEVRGDACADPFHNSMALIDLDGDGAPDGGTSLPRCIGCAAFAAVDLDADGAEELVVLLQGGTTPEYGLYESSHANSERSPGLYPLFLASGATADGFPAESPVTFSVGGDEGYSGAVECEGFPQAPVLVVWSKEHPVDGQGAEVTTIRMTKLRLVYGSFDVIDTTSYEQPTSDPLPFDRGGTACGVDWDPLA